MTLKKIFIASLIALAFQSQLPAATVPFTFSVDAQLTLLSPVPVVGIEANGSLSSDPFGAGTYFTKGVLDYSAVNPDGSSTGAGIFTFDFGGGNSFGGTFIEIAFPPDSAGDIVFSHVYTITAGSGIFQGASGAASHPNSVTNLGPLAIAFDGSGTVSAPGLKAVPEPASVLLTGLGSLLLLRRRRCRANAEGLKQSCQTQGQAYERSNHQ